MWLMRVKRKKKYSKLSWHCLYIVGIFRTKREERNVREFSKLSSLAINYLMVYEQQIVDQSKAICRSSLTCFSVITAARWRRKRNHQEVHWMIPHNDRTMNGLANLQGHWLYFSSIEFFLIMRTSKNDHLFESNFLYFFIRIVVKKIVFARASLLIPLRVEG